MTYSVLICDDDPETGAELVEKVRRVAPQRDYSVLDAPDNKDTQCAIKELLVRQGLTPSQQQDKSPCLFDKAEILVLDYDLLHVDKDNARHTGESLARLARMFSNAEVVVVYNQFQGVHFDLSLRGHLSSHADLNLDACLLDTPGLWADPPWDGFRPWHWQTLHRAVETQNARRQLVAEHFDEAIVDVLGMREEDLLGLSDTAVGFIAPDARDWEGVRTHTFKSFAQSLGNGKRTSKLLALDAEAACRFAAARIGKWLERRILGPQNVLIDLPHLIQRFPFLLEDDLANPAIWTAAVCGGEEVKRRVPKGCWFEPVGLSRPAVWSARLEEHKGIRERRASFDYSLVPPLVFLEDMSAFGQLQEATQFRAGHHNVYDRRFAQCVAGKVYTPQRRLAFAE